VTEAGDPAVGECRHRRVLAADRGVIGWAADDLLRLFVEDRVAARVQRVDAVEHRPGVVAGRIGFWRRGAELDRGIE